MARPVCRLCGNFAESKDALISESGGIRTACRITCTTCGTYDVTMMLEAVIRSYSQDERYRLSGITRHATERGEIIELTSTSAPDYLARYPPLSPIDQADLVLDYLDAHSSPGTAVPVSMERDYTVAQALGAKGLQFLVNSLLRQGLIERTDQSALPHYRLTMTGYERVKQRRKAMPPTVKRAGWEKVDRQVAAAKQRLDEAKFEEDYQQVGLLCRESLISAAQAVFQAERHPTIDGVAASPTDAKRMLEAVVAAQLPGESNEETRSLAKAAIKLALALQHKRTADRQAAAICFEATAVVVRIVATIAGSDPKSD